MTPRVTTKSPLFGRGLRFAAFAFAVLAGTILARDVSATPTSITTRPATPTVCDSVGLILAGSIPNSCYHVIGAWVSRIRELPTAGPIPTYAIGVRITVQEPNPLIDIACSALLQPYERGFRLGRLPFGRYLVNAVEYLVPFSPDSSAAPKDSSKLDSAFSVNVATCPPGVGCALLSFAPSDSSRPDRCDGSARPGGTACFDVVLMNEVPVGGLQTEIVVNDTWYDPPYGSTQHLLFLPTSVEVVGRAADFRVAWTGLSGSRVRILLFSAAGAAIAPGRGPILRVCYSVASETPEGRYPIRYSSTVIADPKGDEIPPCLTFAEIVGSICVAKTGCDLNGDGISDILDVVQLVHCALAGPGSDACPDSVAAKADCNGDGVVNIRDVICCVRKILDGGGFGSGGGSVPPDTTGATRIGFTGPVEWTGPADGRATIEIQPGDGFAGIQFGINAHSSPARIREIRLLSDAYQLESSIDPGGGIARAMIFPSAAGLAAPGPIRVEVILEPAIGSTGNKGMTLFAATSANLAAKAMATRWTAPTAEVPQAPGAGAPSLSVPAPNPFAVGTEIAYAIPNQRHVTLRIYSATGRLVRTLVDAAMPGGVHRVQWDGRDSAGREARSGIYFFKFTAGDVERTARVMRLR